MGGQHDLSWYRQRNAKRVREWLRQFKPAQLDLRSVAARVLPRQAQRSSSSPIARKLEQTLDVIESDETPWRNHFHRQPHNPSRYCRVRGDEGRGIELYRFGLARTCVVTS